MKDKITKSMHYIVPGQPVAWMRTGVNRNRFYDRQKKDKNDYGLLLQAQHQDKTLFKGALEMVVTFYMPIASSFSKKNRANIEGAWHKFRPDLDNALKFLLDACTGILFDDDCCLVSVIAKKMYSCNPRTEFSIQVVE